MRTQSHLEPARLHFTVPGKADRRGRISHALCGAADPAAHTDHPERVDCARCARSLCALCKRPLGSRSVLGTDNKIRHPHCDPRR